MNLLNYQSIFFDCDGVILDSNKIKSISFYNTAAKYCQESAGKLLKYHQENGGISRYIKFKYFIEKLLPLSSSPKYHYNSPSIDELLEEYAKQLADKLLVCKIAKNLNLLRSKTKKSDWYVITGGDENEVKKLFMERNIERYFNMGIYGSPKTKEEILAGLMSSNQVRYPAIFLGDSKYDFEVAKKYKLDFIFISGWTEVMNWEQYVKENSLNHIKCINDLI